MVAGFELVSDIGDNDVLEHFLGKASQLFAKNAALEIVDGIGQHVSAQDDVVSHIYAGMVPHVNDLRPAVEDTTTTRGEKIKGCPVGDLIFESDITPLFNDVAAGANATLNTAVFPAGGYGGEATNDLVGGTVYFPLLGTQHTIVTDTFGGGNHTITFVPPAVRAVTTGDTVRALPFSKGKSPKLMATTPHLGLSNAVADKTGGKTLISAVFLDKKRVRNSFLRS